MKFRLILAASVLLALFSTAIFAQTTLTSSIAPTLEFSGTIQSANATAIVINGQLIDIQSAQINVPTTAGTTVQVQGVIEADGNIRAMRIDPVSPGLIPGIVEIDGVIDSLYDCGIVVGGVPIGNCDAEISGLMTVNQTVRVFAQEVTSGRWEARFIAAANILAPVGTPEVIAPVATPEVVPPVATPEVIAPVSTPDVIAPVQTPEVSGGHGADDPAGDDHGGHGSDDHGGGG